MNKLQKGQGMVEFALTLVILIIIVAGMIDVAPMIFNVYAAKQMSARGARAAAIYAPDGVRSCRNDAIAAIGNPGLMSANWTAEVSPNCDYNPLSTLARGESVWVTVNVDYKPMFWGGFGYPPKDTASVWPFSMGTVDQAR